jgi:Leucine-rich repeat (LRR) protein
VKFDPKKLLMKHLVFALFILTLIRAHAQQSYPVFASKKDSAAFNQINEAIMNIFKNEQHTSSAKMLDSLSQLRMEYMKKIIGTKTNFATKQGFTPLEDVVQGKVDPLVVQQLSLANHSSKKIPALVYACKNVQELEILNSSVAKLPKKLGELKSLKSIYLYNNRTTRSLKFAKNKNVKALLLRGMEQRHLPKTYKKLEALEDLNLAFNIGLTNFPGIYENKKLKKLTLYQNNITLNDLKEAPQVPLVELNLQRNKITTVPDAIGSFSSLKKITFNYNEIEEVNPGIGRLKTLEEVSFYNNKLKAIPSGIYALQALKTIDLYHNEIARVEDDIVKLKSLEILYLSNNLLATLPDNLGELENLRELYVSNNKLFVLPPSLKDLKKLTVLRVNKNKLSDFPEFVFDLPAIENLDISSNSINTIPYRIMDLPKLNIFVLSDNPVNREEVNIAKIVKDLRAKGTVVHQNFISEQVEDDREEGH